MGKSETSKIFSERLELLTEERRDIDYKLSNKDQAKEMGIPYPTFTKYLHDGAECGIFYLKKIANYYGVSTDYLLGLTDVKAPETNLRAICEYTGLTETAVEAIRLFKEQGDFLSTLFSAFQFQSVICELLKIPETSNQCLSAAMNKDHKTVKELFQRTDFLCYRAEKEFRRVIDMFDARQKETPLNYITGEPMNKQK